MQHQGLQHLLLPHRFSRWGVPDDAYDRFPEKDMPLAIPNLFPLPNPALMGIDPMQVGVVTGGAPPKLSFLRLARMDVHTKEETHTKIPDSVKKYDRHKQLKKVKISDPLWTMLVKYAVGHTTNVVEPEGPNGRLVAEQASFHTYRPEVLLHLPVPGREEQLQPIFNLWGWYLMHLSMRAPVVNSEFSVHDEVHRQLLHPMNEIMKIRYGPIAAVNSHNVTRTLTPVWNRFVEDHRASNNRPNVQPQLLDPQSSTSKGGIPDFVLYFREGLMGQAAVFECKTSWSYTSHYLHIMLSNYNYGRQNFGEVDWDFPGLANDILKQLWSEMHELQVRFGIWTNGEEIVVAIDTTDYTTPEPRENELTFSLIQDIHDSNYIYQGIAGFCLASIEFSLIPNNELQRREFINNLCPPGTKRPPIDMQRRARRNLNVE